MRGWYSTNMGSDIIYVIGVGIVGVGLICLFVIYPILVFVMRHSDTDTQKCRVCKGKMVAIETYLYLLPIHFDEQHEESAKYYIQNARPIADVSQIPSGNRACYLHLFRCQSCGHKNISAVDFLKVREQEVIMGGDIYPYKEFKYFMMNNSLEKKEII